MNIIWQCLHFNELNTTTLYEILKARQMVFSVEQNCAYLDLDGLDQTALHLIAWDNEQLAGYARLMPPNTQYPEASIGRVLTLPGYRGSGLGKQLISKAIVECQEQFHTGTIKLGAQQYLEDFYQRHGFQTISQPYLEDGIWHIKMLKAPV